MLPLFCSWWRRKKQLSSDNAAGDAKTNTYFFLFWGNKKYYVINNVYLKRRALFSVSFLLSQNSLLLGQTLRIYFTLFYLYPSSSKGPKAFLNPWTRGTNSKAAKKTTEIFLVLYCTTSVRYARLTFSSLLFHFSSISKCGMRLHTIISDVINGLCLFWGSQKAFNNTFLMLLIAPF